MFNVYTRTHVMDDYQRPAAKKAARQAVDGLLPEKTNTADPNIQPFRHAQIAASETRSPKPKRLVRLELGLQDDDSSHNVHHHERPRIKKVNRLRRVLLRAAVATLVVLIGLGGLIGSQGYIKLHKVFKGTAGTAAALQSDVDPSLLKEGDGRINVLLVGIGGQGHDGADLTDTMVVASIDPVNNTATLLSVPRDLWVTLPGKGSMKLNAAYETGKYAYLHKISSDNTSGKAVQAGFSSLDQTLSGVLGISINYNLLVNFQAFRQAVDTVGGVTVNVPADLYDPTMAWENNRNPYLARAGQQVFDGKHALIYVRSRETSSDFARSERQRAVLLALKQKAVTLGVLANPSKISGLLGAFGDNVQTDLSLSDASRLYNAFKQIDNSKIGSLGLAGTTSSTSSAAGNDSLVTTGMLGGQSVVLPKAGAGHYAAIQDYVHSHLVDGHILKEHARVAVVAPSLAVAQAESAQLSSFGYTIASSTVSSTASKGLIDVSHGKDQYTKHYLERRYGVAKTALPAGITNTTNADFVVVLDN